MKKASSKLLLLDVNVLLAIAWPNHQFHAIATQTMELSSDQWATCALTQLGFIRLSSNPSVIPAAKSPAEALSILEAMIADSAHTYLDSLPSPVGMKSLRSFERILGHKQVTDAYLLSLAQENQATFVTFDARLKGLSSELTILGA